MTGSPGWAGELREAGLDGGTDEIRARAYLDLLLGKDSRPGGPPPGVPAQPGAVPAGFASRVTLTVPLATLTGLAGRPGELAGLGPVDPWLARDLARRRRAQPEDHVVRDRHRQPGPRHRARLRPARTQEPPQTRRPRPAGVLLHSRPAGTGRPGADMAPGGCAPPDPGPDLIITLDPVTTDPCDHRHQASGHDPGVKLRHLSQVRHATCTSPVCRRPAAQCDHEHNTPYEAGGRTCLCNTGPKCRHDHRLKQHPKWKVDQLPDGTFRWTTPSGRTYTTEPTRYPI